jgi:hypothetical protein
MWRSLILEKFMDDQALNSLAEELSSFGPRRAPISRFQRERATSS